MSNDRALGMRVPQYEDPNLITKADLAYWEALYDDGTVLRETDNKTYFAIDRGRLSEFRVIHHGEIMAAIRPEGVRGATGHNLVFRRRIRMSSQGDRPREQVLLLGFAPMGPVLCLDLDRGTYQISDEGFKPGDPVFAPPAPLEGEPETMAIARKKLIIP